MNLQYNIELASVKHIRFRTESILSTPLGIIYKIKMFLDNVFLTDLYNILCTSIKL